MCPAYITYLGDCAVQCGKCLEKCPQHLEIPKLLESVVDELEGPDLEMRVAMAKEAFKRT